jgi:hypothetical protein
VYFAQRSPGAALKHDEIRMSFRRGHADIAQCSQIATGNVFVDTNSALSLVFIGI